MELTRSVAFCEGSLSVREQMNGITAFVDASNVYGSEEETANKLREVLALLLSLLDSIITYEQDYAHFMSK